PAGNNTCQAAQSTATVTARASRIATKPQPILAITAKTAARSARASSQATIAKPSSSVNRRRKRLTGASYAGSPPPRDEQIPALRLRAAAAKSAPSPRLRGEGRGEG